MNTNIYLIELFTNSNILRQYAVYLRLKHIYSNGCIYDYNVNKLARQSGLSRNSIKKYVGFFISNGWARMHDGNLTFISLKNLRSKYGITLKKTINIKSGRIQEILTSLRFELLKHKNNQFIFLRDISNDLHNPSGKDTIKRHKAAKRYCAKNGNVQVSESALKISLEKIGTIINLSASSAYNLMRDKAAEKRVKIVKEPFKKIKFNYSGRINNYINGFTLGTYLFVPTCNKYVFS